MKIDIDQRSMLVLLKLYQHHRLKFESAYVTAAHELNEGKQLEEISDYPFVDQIEHLRALADLAEIIARKLRHGRFSAAEKSLRRALQPLITDQSQRALDLLNAGDHQGAARLVLQDSSFLDHHRVRQAIHLRAELVVGTWARLLELFPKEEEVRG